MKKNVGLTLAITLILLLLSTPSINGWVQARAQEDLPPGSFTKLTPIDLSAFQSVWTITLDWDESVGATEYEYCFDKTDDDTCDDSWISTGMNTSAEITFLDANTTYYWQARAFDGDIHTEADGGIWWSFTTGGYARFHVQVDRIHVVGYDWRPGNSVTMTVDDPANGIGVDFTDTKTVTSNGNVLFYDLGSLQIDVGMHVTMTDGVVFKSHTVVSLQVTEVDADTDIVSGTGEIGALVNVQHCQYNGCLWQRFATIQPDGTWQVNFSVIGSGPEEQEILDIVPGTTGEALIWDNDGDHTGVDWYSIQKFVAYPVDDYIDGSDWPLGSTMTIEIDDPTTLSDPDYTDNTTVIVHPIEISSTYFIIEFKGLYDLKPGDLVTVTDGTTTKTHTVTSLQVSKVNPTSDVVSGTAAPNSYVDLEICGGSGCTYRSELADSNGLWSANFGVVGDQPWEQTTCDILTDTTGNLRQWDDDTDSTLIPWIMMYDVFLPLILH